MEMLIINYIYFCKRERTCLFKLHSWRDTGIMNRLYFPALVVVLCALTVLTLLTRFFSGTDERN